MLYTIQSGDTLFKIAQKFNTTVDVILSLNPQITNPDLIFTGQKIILPPKAQVVLCPFLRLGDRGPDVSRLQILLKVPGFDPGPIDGIFGQRTYRALVRFQGSVKEFEETTGVADSDTWVMLGAECEPREGITKYIVRPGEGLFIIAARFKVSVETLLLVNPEIKNPDKVFAGQTINIPII